MDLSQNLSDQDLKGLTLRLDEILKLLNPEKDLKFTLIIYQEGEAISRATITSTSTEDFALHVMSEAIQQRKNNLN